MCIGVESGDGGWLRERERGGGGLLVKISDNKAPFQIFASDDYAVQ